MDLQTFQSRKAGRVIFAEQGYWAFLPHPLPPHIDWTPRLINALSEAERTLGYLGALGQILPQAHGLTETLQRQDAVCSACIEGTHVTLLDIYRHELLPPQRRPQKGAVVETYDYVRALKYGLREVQADVPITLDLVLEIHARLWAHTPESSQAPGEFRKTPTWAGFDKTTLDNAVYVPPPPERMLSVLDAWEYFLYAPSDLPNLIRLGLAHYYFEAIHPFIYSNGRVARLLLVLLLVAWDILPQPYIYLNAYVQQHYQTYNSLLLGVSQRGDWESWLVFFLHALVIQSRAALTRGQRLGTLYHSYQEQYQNSPRRQATIDVLFEKPLVTATFMAKQSGVSISAIYGYLAEFEKNGILIETTGKERGRRYLAPDIFNIIEDPLVEVVG